MKKLDYNLIPKLSTYVEIQKSNNDEYICVQREFSHIIRVNSFTYNLLNLLDGKRNLVQITADFNSQVQCDCSIDEVYTLIDGKLKELGFVDLGTEYRVKKTSPNYLHLRMDVIKCQYSSKITKYIYWMFNPKYFFISFALLGILTYILFIFLLMENLEFLNNITISDIICIFFLMGIALIFHELGHIAACDRFGIKHGNIGFGFYLLCPVMYADITEVWRLSKKDRIIVNLAGIYLGNIFSLIFISLFVIFNKDVFLYAFYLQCLEGLFNLNPLIKYDGYWVLADILESYNLSSESFKTLRAISRNRVQNYSKRDWFLIIYSLVSSVFIIAFLCYVLFVSENSLLDIPYKVWEYIRNIYMGINTINLLDIIGCIPGIFFYIMAFRFLKSKLFDK